MPCKLVTCPESGHLEMVVYEDTPFGWLIDGCTRFGPGCELDCPRSCAARRPSEPDEDDDLAVGDTTLFDLEPPSHMVLAEAAATIRTPRTEVPPQLRALLDRFR